MEPKPSVRSQQDTSLFGQALKVKSEAGCIIRTRNVVLSGKGLRCKDGCVRAISTRKMELLNSERLWGYRLSHLMTKVFSTYRATLDQGKWCLPLAVVEPSALWLHCPGANQCFPPGSSLSPWSRINRSWASGSAGSFFLAADALMQLPLMAVKWRG